MIEISTLRQPESGTLAAEIGTAANSGRYTDLRIAVAYVTHGGVKLLAPNLDPALAGLNIKLLAGIDWCRSDVSALDAIAGLPSAEVRIVDGDTVVKHRGCVPSRSYHPKGFLFSGAGGSRLVAGSGNLSANGLARSRELGISLEVGSRSSSVDQQVWRSIQDTQVWFDDLWDVSTSYAAIRTDYLAECATALKLGTQTDDDLTPTIKTGGGAFKPEELVRIRKSRFFWIDTGSNKNLGSDGNQVMLRRNTRVFFGGEAQDVPKNTVVASPELRYRSLSYDDRNLRYEDNGMDVLNMPSPHDVLPNTYQDSTVLFERTSDAGRIVYDLTFLERHARGQSQKASSKVDLLFPLKGSVRCCGFY